MIERALTALARSTTSRPLIVWLALALVTASAAALVPRFRIDPDVASMLPDGHPAVDLIRDLGDDSSRSLFLILRGTNVADRLPEAISRLRSLDRIERVDATWEEVAGERARLMREAPLHYLPESAVERLRARLAGPGRLAAIDESLERLATDPLAGAEVVMRDPLGLRWALDTPPEVPRGFDSDSPYLVQADGALALVRVIGTEKPFDIEFSRSILADIDEQIGELFEQPLTRLGGYESATRDAGRIKSDLSSSLYVSIPLILLFLFASTRSVVLPHLYLLPVGVAVIWAIGFGGVLLGPLTPLAISGAAILIGLGVDFCIHYAGRLDEELDAGMPWPAAVERAHSRTGRAILAGLTTTIAGFLSFAFGSFPGLFGFGLLLALGLLFACATSLSMLPMTLKRVLLGRRAGRPTPTPAGPVILFAERITRSRAAWPVACGVLVLAGGGWVLVFASGLTFDADPSFMRPREDNERAEALAEELGFSALPLLVLTAADTPLDATRDALDHLIDEGALRFAEGAHSVVPDARRRELVSEFRAATAGWLAGALADFERKDFNSEVLRAPLEQQAALLSADPEIDEARLQTEWRGSRWWKFSAYASAPLSDPAERVALRQAMNEAFDVPFELVDPYGLADELGPILAADLARALGACAVLVVLLVVIWVGSLGAGLIALIPVVAGLGIAMGALVLFGVPLHPGNFVALPLILGLGVDDGIHLVLRYREGGAVRSTTQAIWRTSVTTALGFGSLVSAQSPALASMGGIVLIGVLVCFASSVLVLPPLLSKHAENRS